MSGHRAWRRIGVVAALGAAVAAGAAASPASAATHTRSTARPAAVVGNPPGITVNMYATGLTMPAVLRSQRYGFTVVARNGPATFQLLRPHAGLTKQQFLADVGNPATLGKAIDEVTQLGGAASGGGLSGVFWETLYPGVYWVLDSNQLGSPALTYKTLKTVIVYGSTIPRTIPATNVAIGMYNFGFLNSPAVLPSYARVRLDNIGVEPHFFELERLNPGVSQGAVLWCLQPRHAGEKACNNPAHPQTTTAAVSGTLNPGTREIFQYRAAPGSYVELCFFPDDDHMGTPHAFEGMVKFVTIR